jgi:hypothetical protein
MHKLLHDNATFPHFPLQGGSHDWIVLADGLTAVAATNTNYLVRKLKVEVRNPQFETLCDVELVQENPLESSECRVPNRPYIAVEVGFPAGLTRLSCLT